MPDVPPNIAAVLSALRFSASRPESLRTLTDSEWESLLSRWQIRRLMIPLRRTCGDALPEWVRSRIDLNLADNAQRFERIKLVYSDFANALRDTGAEHLVVKGFTHWPDFVEHPTFRLQSDLDVYCPPESSSRAREALSSLGYQPLAGAHGRADANLPDHLPTMVRNTGWKWRGNFYDPEMPISFEIHFRLWNEKLLRFGPKELEPFWLRRIERRLDDISFPALNPVDNLGYSALNVLRDALCGEVSVQLVYELARFLHINAENDEFWRSWRELHDDSLRGAEAVSFSLALHHFDCRLPGEVETEINRLPVATKLWFERYADSPLSSSFRENKDALWLHLSLIESRSDKRTVLLKRLFPTRIPSLDAPYIQNPVKDRQESFAETRKRLRYIGYLTSRVSTHLRVLPSTLWHGARLWWSSKELSEDFLTFLAVWFLVNFGIYIFFFLYNLYLLDRGLRENVLGLMTSAMTLGSVAGTIPAGMLAQRVGIRNSFLVCLTTLSLVSALRLQFVSQPPLLVFAFIAGSFSAILPVALTPAIAQLTNEKSRPLGFSVVLSTGIALGILGGPVASRLPGWLMQMSASITAPRAKEAALLLACGVMAVALLPASRLRFASRPARQKRIYPRNPFIFRFLTAMAIWSFAIGGFSPFFNVYFSRYLQTPLKHLGTIYSISHISQLVAMLAAPVLFRKFGLVTGIVYTQIATAIALGCLATASGASAATMIYMGYVAFQWMSEPGILTLLMNHVAPKEQAGASSLNILVINTSQAIAAAAAGFSFVRFGYPVVLSVLSGVALSAALLFRLLLGKDSLLSLQSSHASEYGD
jgi:MFS family permease